MSDHCVIYVIFFQVLNFIFINSVFFFFTILTLDSVNASVWFDVNIVILINDHINFLKSLWLFWVILSVSISILSTLEDVLSGFLVPSEMNCFCLSSLIIGWVGYFYSARSGIFGMSSIFTVQILDSVNVNIRFDSGIVILMIDNIVYLFVTILIRSNGLIRMPFR